MKEMPSATKTKAASEGRVEKLRRSDVMSRLMDDLEAGVDVGHYGRLTYAIVARFFQPQEEIVALLARQPDQDEIKAAGMVEQVVERGYSPPKRERLLEWQAKQDYPIIADPDDPAAGNLYRDLEFPDDTYDHISEYHEAQVEAHLK
jgi:predicted Ser/Thr protein kinase